MCWRELLILILTSPAALEVIRQVAESLRGKVPHALSSLPPAERERLVLSAAGEVIERVIRERESPVQTKVVQTREKGDGK